MSVLLLASAAALAPECQTTIIQSELNACAIQSLADADDALNNQWRITVAVYNALSQADAERLRNAQRKWIAFRDAQCAAEWPWSIGVSLDKMLYVFCLESLTRERTEELKRMAEAN